MKIIKLFLLSTFVLWSNYILLDKIPTPQFEAIIQNGWNDSNQTLNHMIIGHVEKNDVKIATVIAHPLTTVEPTEKDPFPTPVLNYTRHDAFLIVSYIKYLEYSGKKEKAIRLYTKLLRGLSEADTTTMTPISVIFRMVIENIITDGLSHALKSNIYHDKSEKIILKNMLKKSLILDTDIFFSLLKNAKDSSHNYLKKNILKVPNNRYKEFGEKYAEAYYLSLDKYINLYYSKQIRSFQKIIELKNISPSKELNAYFITEKSNTFDRFSDKLKLEELYTSNFDIALLEKNLILYSPEWLARMLVLLSMPHFGPTELDFVLQIDKNSQLLKMLD